MRLSTGLVNKMTDTCSLKDAIAGFVLDVYSGVQPTLPDNAINGTKLVTVSLASGAYTAETASTGSITITGTTGTVTAVTVNTIDILGATVTNDGTVAGTAVLLAAQINRNPKNQLFVASATGLTGVVTLTAVGGLGTLPNGWVVAHTGATTATYANMASGVNSVNGLNWDTATVGVISKVVAETWSGNGVSDGTASWMRLRGAGDAGTAASATAVRADFSISTSGADMNVGSLTVTTGAPFIIPTATLTLPQQ